MRRFSFLFAALAVVAAFEPAGAETPEAAVKLIILGTGTPNADPDRSGPALAIIVDDQAFLFDAGPGVVRRAAAAARKGEKALEAEKLDTAFLTHLHSDHTLGLPDLIFSPWVLERQKPLDLYGPPGTAAMARNIEKAWSADRHLRLSGLEPANPTGWKVETHEIKKPGAVYEKGGVSIEAFPVKHGSWKYAYGYKLSAHGKTIVISGDATPSPALIDAAKDADILIHEVYSEEGFNKRPPEWRRYHKAFHTSTRELAEIANETQPKRLILYHQLYWGYTDDDLVREIREAGYEGATNSARDLDIYVP
ncbi:MAG: MBL fold metallo-hydrolase [Parvularculaceae bacterium]